ncbi:MAG: DUF4082 domain-containing protein [Bacteroidetes bacterium]|nr:DUF4082 domain-containing protein [Bacteroidota bacterium]
MQTRFMRFATLCLAVILFAATFTSCKKDDPDPVPTPKAVESAPVNKTFFVNTPVTIQATGAGNYEYGMKFTVTQNGKVTKLASRMPQAGTYRVTLWDASATPKVAIGTASITQTAGALTYQSITPVSLTTGKDYFISVWSSGQWYEIRPIGGGTFAYPIVIGSVSLSGYQWAGTPASPQTFPTNSDNTYVAGLPDFEFQPD